MSIQEALWRVIDRLRQRKANYQMTFRAPGAPGVLRDLARFCRANQPIWDDDPRHHARMTGRHEVWARITQHLELSPEELAVLYRAEVNLGDQDV